MSPSPPPAELRARLLPAWAEWDQRPGDKGTANRLVDLIIAYVGLSSLCEFRREVAGARRAGLSLALALTEWDITHD